MNKSLSEIQSLFWKRRLHTSQAIDRGLHTPRTQQHLQLHCNFFSKQCGYSKGEHMLYSASILEINDMKGLQQGKRLVE